MTGAGLGTVLIAFAVLLPSMPAPDGARFIETQLCASGRTLRIELPGGNEPERHAPMPCHAVCARGEDPVKRIRT
ncbi:MAG: hypothetical protein AAF311_04765 [Pseudomonadota bacterium]